MSTSVNKINESLCKELSWRHPVNSGNPVTIEELSNSCEEAFEFYADAVGSLF